MSSGRSAEEPGADQRCEVEHEPDIDASAIAAVARTRAHGMHYFGQILGIRPRPADGGPTGPELAPDCSVTPGAVPPVALAALADLAMGSAVRTAVGDGRRLGTVTMALHHIAAVVIAPVSSAAHLVWIDEDQRHALARVDCIDARGVLVAAGQGWFTSLPAPTGVPLRPLPWEFDELPAVPPVAADELEHREQAAVEATRRAAGRARTRGTSVSEELTALDWDATAPEGTARGSLRIGPEMTNRVGHLQGGALYGIGLAAAARAVGSLDGSADRSAALVPADGSWQFLAPGDGEALVAEAVVRRAGRRTAFASVTLTVDGRDVGAGQFAFRQHAAD